MAELVDAFRNNFEGKEELRRMLINKAPKFVTDYIYIDNIAKEAHIRTNAKGRKARGYFGIPLRLDGSIGGGYFSLSFGNGATSDGRLDRVPCVDSNASKEELNGTNG